MVDRNLFCVIKSFEMFILASQLVNGNVTFIKLFPIITIRFGDKCSFSGIHLRFS